MNDDTKTLTIHGAHGRDVGKTFYALEIEPLVMAGFVLRLVAALNVPSYEDLLTRLQDVRGGGVPIDAIMQLLQGADPQAIHALITELLQFVQISPDPKHPGARRALLASDMRELATLGDVLKGILTLNFDLGA